MVLATQSQQHVPVNHLGPPKTAVLDRVQTTAPTTARAIHHVELAIAAMVGMDWIAVFDNALTIALATAFAMKRQVNTLTLFVFVEFIFLLSMLTKGKCSSNHRDVCLC